MSQDFSGLKQAFDFQRAACAHLGSPFSARVLAILDWDIQAGGAYAGFVRPWAGADPAQALSDVTPLRLLAALHYLALSGAGAGLAAVYPANGADAEEDALRAAILRAGELHRGVIEGFMPSPPQTNEVRRSICLLGGFMTVARETGSPLRCLEIGTSAGLNQNWNRFRYRLGEVATWGDADSPVLIDAEWRGEAPPLVDLTVAERRGCDLRPIDTADPDQALRLQAYVWADQADRLERLRGAIALARLYPPTTDQGDAADWVEAQARPRPGMATVLYHSVVWQYLPAATQARITAAIEAAGREATPESPFAWLRMEPDPTGIAKPMEIRLSLWPEGREAVLARVHPHGAMVSWLSSGADAAVI
ncbi:DUF2332 domain-containing protein [Phenylobacterium montanum]|uniref:DUF2332 family protein n=1 Tax=Phenylobacterium montanum TaxID=2823693 RepID=A0A975G0C7_9CAUL|nr:DUF2332 family protein [Caulobacter sp. S6]QUD88459.1 DUF2332 family protein [Caulobacter sp. S6]